MKLIDLECGLDSNVVMIRQYIMITSVTKKSLVKNKYKINESAMNAQNKDINYMDSVLVKYKYKTRPSEATEETKKIRKKSRRTRKNVSISRTVFNITMLYWRRATYPAPGVPGATCWCHGRPWTCGMSPHPTVPMNRGVGWDVGWQQRIFGRSRRGPFRIAGGLSRP